MVNVVVASQKRVKVTANAAGAVDTNVTLRNSIPYNSINFRLDHLGDVVEQNPSAGDTLVYNANTDKYVVKKLALSQLDIDTTVPAGDIDGGSF